MMQMLEAGGMPVFVGPHGRTPNSGNARGSYEHDAPAGRDTAWLAHANGHAVKVVEDWLDSLPYDIDAKFICMRRDLREVSASRGYSLEAATEHAAKLHAWLRAKDRLFVFHSRLVTDPGPEIERINAFLGSNLDTAAMARVIDLSLWHHRAT